MFYHLFYPLKEIWFGFNIFRYITFRAGMAAVTAFIISMIIGPVLIKYLSKLKIGQYIRKDHVETLHELHKHKQGTPTMGGFIILFSLIISMLLWCRLDNKFVILSFITLIWLGIVGFIDDYIKMIMKRSLGLRTPAKLAGQLLLAVLVGVYLYLDPDINANLYLPFLKNAVLNLGIFYILLVILVLVGSTNAVNLTDGLDGLAIGCVIIISMTFAVITYVTGHADISGYLNIYFVPQAGELSVICAAIVGCGLGFLWFNAHPADVFMGDTGSLPLGGIIGLISVLVKKEVVLFLAGGIFVIEVISVLLQIYSLRFFKKRIFLCTPLHHHFEYKGIKESKVIIRFWIVAIILSLISLVTLKVR